MGKVYTFYSYKGGVGRTMAMANVGALLSIWGKKVLMIDWDLEAPGLENYFKEGQETFINDIRRKEGLIDLLIHRKNNIQYDAGHIIWTNHISSIPIPNNGQSFHLDLLHAGRKDDNYIKRVREMDYGSFYEENGGGDFLEEMRAYWINAYDIILIDSRTGLTDSGGVCSIQMPDAVVMLFTATDQGFQGTINIAKRALEAQKSIIYDRYALKILPVPTRFDSTEFKLQREWLTKFEHGLKDIYKTWVPEYPGNENINLDHRQILDLTKLPYIPYFSYGEKLPVIEQGTNDPQGLGYAFETVSAILAHDLEGAKLLTDNRTEYVRRAIKKISPYEEIEPQVNISPVPSKTYKYILAGLIVATLFLMSTLFWNKYDQQLTTTMNIVQQDSFEKQAALLELQNYFLTIDTNDIDAILDLNKKIYQKGFGGDTSSVIAMMCVTIKNRINKELEFNIPLIYEDIGNYRSGINTTNHVTLPLSSIEKYFASFIYRFGPFNNITKERFKQKIREAKNLNGFVNNLESGSLDSLIIDSSGFSVKFYEIANFYFKDTALVQDGSKYRIPVRVHFDQNLMINSFLYAGEKKALLIEKKPPSKPVIPKLPVKSKSSEILKKDSVPILRPNVIYKKVDIRIRVDIIAVGKKITNRQNLLSSIIFEELTKSNNYIPRISKDPFDKKEISGRGNIILYPPELKSKALDLSSLLSKQTLSTYKPQSSTTLSGSYIIIYIQDEGTTNINLKQPPSILNPKN